MQQFHRNTGRLGLIGCDLTRQDDLSHRRIERPTLDEPSYAASPFSRMVTGRMPLLIMVYGCLERFWGVILSQRTTDVVGV